MMSNSGSDDQDSLVHSNGQYYTNLNNSLNLDSNNPALSSNNQLILLNQMSIHLSGADGNSQNPSYSPNLFNPNFLQGPSTSSSSTTTSTSTNLMDLNNTLHNNITSA